MAWLLREAVRGAFDSSKTGLKRATGKLTADSPDASDGYYPMRARS